MRAQSRKVVLLAHRPSFCMSSTRALSRVTRAEERRFSRLNFFPVSMSEAVSSPSSPRRVDIRRHEHAVAHELHSASGLRHASMPQNLILSTSSPCLFAARRAPTAMRSLWAKTQSKSGMGSAQQRVGHTGTLLSPVGVQLFFHYRKVSTHRHYAVETAAALNGARRRRVRTILQSCPFPASAEAEIFRPSTPLFLGCRHRWRRGCICRNGCGGRK